MNRILLSFLIVLWSHQALAQVFSPPQSTTSPSNDNRTPAPDVATPFSQLQTGAISLNLASLKVDGSTAGTLLPVQGLIGQGAATFVTMFARPTAVAGRHYALVGQLSAGASSAGDKVGVFGGAETGIGGSNVWGGNFIVQRNAGHTRTIIQGVEVDLNNNDADVPLIGGNFTTGVNITSGGKYRAGIGLSIDSTSRSLVSGNNQWRRGIHIPDGAVSDQGIAIGNASIPAALIAKQLVTAGDTVVLQRRDDTHPGYYVRGVNAANNATIFGIDGSGTASFGALRLTGTDTQIAATGFTLGPDGKISAAGVDIEARLGSPAPAKSADISFYGRDTKNTRKMAGGISTVPADGNWIGSDIVIKTRQGDATVERWRIRSDGHLMASGAAPTTLSCGTSPAIYGTDSAGEMIQGTRASGCTMVFANEWPSPPFCTVTSQEGLAFAYKISKATITITNIDALSATKLNYQCSGKQ